MALNACIYCKDHYFSGAIALTKRSRQMKPLTERQAEVLNAVHDLSANGHAPSLDEVGERVGLRGSWAVRRHLDILARKGFLKPRGYRKPRDIALIEGGGGAIAA